jgi:hypothetical protein
MEHRLSGVLYGRVWTRVHHTRTMESTRAAEELRILPCLRDTCGMQTSSRRIPLDESSLLRGTLKSDVLERFKLNDICIHPRCMRVINLVMPIDTVSDSQRDRGHIRG